MGGAQRPTANFFANVNNNEKPTHLTGQHATFLLIVFLLLAHPEQPLLLEGQQLDFQIRRLSSFFLYFDRGLSF